ncbi:MAG: hypothetical protein V7K72_24395 [Nostoc sp.]
MTKRCFYEFCYRSARSLLMQVKITILITAIAFGTSEEDTGKPHG